MERPGIEPGFGWLDQSERAAPAGPLVRFDETVCGKSDEPGADGAVPDKGCGNAKNDTVGVVIDGTVTEGSVTNGSDTAGVDRRHSAGATPTGATRSGC